MTKIKRVAHLSLYLEVDGRAGKVMWVRPVEGVPDLTEVSLEFEHGQSRGYQLWFFRGDTPLCCSMYLSPDTQAIRLREEAHRAGISVDALLAKMGGRDGKMDTE